MHIGATRVTVIAVALCLRITATGPVNLFRLCNRMSRRSRPSAFDVSFGTNSNTSNQKRKSPEHDAPSASVSMRHFEHVADRNGPCTLAAVKKSKAASRIEYVSFIVVEAYSVNQDQAL
jgi:hypothetical protein